MWALTIFAIAREIGRYMGRKIQGPVNVVYVRSTATDTGCPALRFGGIMGGISDETMVSHVKLIDERYATKDVGEADGMMQMEELLASNEKIDVVIGHHDAQSLGALTAIRNAKRDDIKLVAGFDGEKRMLEEIKKGGIDMVTGLNSPTMIADISLGIINDIFQGKSVPGTNFIPVTAIHKGNIDEYMQYGF